MSLCHGRAWIEIFFYPVRRQIEAPFEAPAPNSFEKGGNFGATEGLVCKPNAICFCSHGVCEKCNLGCHVGPSIGKYRGRWQNHVCNVMGGRAHR
jgi:hypothetical protein